MSEQTTIVLARTPPFRLGQVEVRPANLELLAPNGRNRLEPRVMQVLVALATAKGEIVSRDDLVDACWEGRIVGQDAINRVISKIRHLAQTAGDGSFTLETITKVGYRLTVVGEEPGVLAPPPPAPPPLAGQVVGEHRPTPPGPDRRLLIGGAVGLAAAAGGGWWWVKGAKSDVPEAAANLYAQGMEASRLGSAEGTSQAVGFLKEAVAEAPDYAEGWGALALAYQNALHFMADDAARSAEERSRAAVQRALELDPRNPSAHAAQALAIPTYGNWLAAERALRKALDLDPSQFECCNTLSRTLASVGRLREAIAALDPISEAARLQPAIQYWLAYLQWSAGRLDESDRVIDRAMSLWPRNYQVWFTRFWLYAHTDRSAQAITMAQDAVSRPQGIPDWNFELIEATARALGSRESADEAAALKANMEAARRGAGFTENAIELTSKLGRMDDAYRLVDAYYFSRGFALGSTRYTTQQGSYTRPLRRQTHFLFSPPSTNLRSDKRFAELTKAIGLTEYWRLSGTRADGVPPPAG